MTADTDAQRDDASTGLAPAASAADLEALYAAGSASVDLSRDPPSADAPHVDVSGDAERGWIVGIHDGSKLHTFSPDAPDAATAEAAAMALAAASRQRTGSPPVPDLAEQLKEDLRSEAARLVSRAKAEIDAYVQSKLGVQQGG